MRRVKRTAISLRAKQPYIQWANGLDEDGVKIGIDFTPEENVYLHSPGRKPSASGEQL